ncbi:MAG: pyruvate, phosphate dikinase [Vulcanimicrobiaceae bacterium]
MLQSINSTATSRSGSKTIKYVYFFEEESANMRDLLGGKGAGLAEMTAAGLPVPAGFTITTEACLRFFETGGNLPDGLDEQVEKAMRELEARTNKTFGDVHDPLLVSVRSGARISMPGMMDTVLNLGLNDQTVEGLAKLTGNERFAWDAYRRFIMMFSSVVLDIPKDRFEDLIDARKAQLGVKTDPEIDAASWRELVEAFKGVVRDEAKREFPQDVREQLDLAIRAVFDSWNSKRAIDYRRYNKIPDDWGTAVSVVSMVFGNMGDDSGTGVAFTRDPNTGERVLFGEYLRNAQGEDVVAGIRTPEKIADLEKTQPKVYRQFVEIARKLERHYRDMQDLEFTVERGKLYMLQTRSGKRSAEAAVRIALDLVNEGLIDKHEALARVDAQSLDQLFHARIDPSEAFDVAGKGLNASPGAAAGQIVFDADTAEQWGGHNGTPVILVRVETTPDDVHGMIAAKGVLTAKGGATSHAAVVARGMGKPCVVGFEAMTIDRRSKSASIDGTTLKEGDWITIDGSTGNVILKKLTLIDPPSKLPDWLATFLAWADQARRLEVWANADTPADAKKARELGAVGIGLCRTEHMFMQQDRLPIVQEMILADTPEARSSALQKLLPFQREDFTGILEAMQGYPVTIRLLDPPLHEFLPSLETLLVETTELRVRQGEQSEKYQERLRLLKRVQQLHEQNPMLGLRVCRLGIVYPEIYAMQVRAIFEAACELHRRGVDVKPEVMIPGVGTREEMKFTADAARKVADTVLAEQGAALTYHIGTMIELPRACVVADELAEHAEFFSFGTNDLTQTTYGYSRDDAEATFIPRYLELKILKQDPFQVLDRRGVGTLMQEGVRRGRSTRPDLKIGICGEHGGEPSSIAFCHGLGLQYVSCSPYRVPIARLAAAQAAIGAIE